MTFTNNTGKNRFELQKEGSVAYADYRRTGNDLYLDYVYAPPELRGTGAAGELMRNIADTALREDLKIIPICGFAVSWLKRNN